MAVLRGSQTHRRPAGTRVRWVAACTVIALCAGAAGASAATAPGGSGGAAPTTTTPPPATAPTTPTTTTPTTPTTTTPTTTTPTPPPEPRTVSIQWVGDTTLGSSYGNPPDAGRSLFRAVRTRLGDADLTFANLETALAQGKAGVSKCGASSGGDCFAFSGPPANAATLAWAGIDIVNQANNHADDYGTAGQAATRAALQKARVAYTGQPGRITVLRRNGIRVAFVGFAPYAWAASLLNIPSAQALVRRAGRKADVVVVAMHAGAEGADKTHTPSGEEHAFGEDRGNARAFAHAVVGAGADLVVASGPHVLRGIERYRGRLIAYSLGNFAGWHTFGRGGVLSLSGMLRVTLGVRGAPLAARFTPLKIFDPGVPHLDPTGASTTLVNRLSREDFGARAAARIGRNGAVAGLPAK